MYEWQLEWISRMKRNRDRSTRTYASGTNKNKIRQPYESMVQEELNEMDKDILWSKNR